MNERFEQMMLEATKDMPQGYYVPGEYFQKFAELIVRECAGIYSKIDNGNSHMGTDNYLEALHKTFRS
jgi:hypothetical protein